MNRRNFLKRIVAVAAGAVAVPTIAKAIPFKPNPAQRWITLREFNKRSCNTVSGGVTQEQLADLIRCTLDDLPQQCFLDFRTGIDNIRKLKEHYSILDIYRSKNANNWKNNLHYQTRHQHAADFEIP